LLLVCLLLAAAAPARADVVRFDITSRAPIGSSGYEKIVGIAHFAVNPRAPGNSVIADVDKAPVNLDGKVEFSSDVYILRPLDAATSNGVALVDVLNRGRKIVLGGFNRGATNDPVTDADLGDAHQRPAGRSRARCRHGHPDPVGARCVGCHPRRLHAERRRPADRG
jgi:hypothetical protein